MSEKSIKKYQLEGTRNQFLELVVAGLFPGMGTRIVVHGVPVCWEEVYRLAEEQALVGLVAAGIDSLPPSERAPQEVVLQFVGSTIQLEQRNKAMNGFIAELIEKLQNHDIFAILIKGQGIAQCYEKPLWRSSGDVDLFLYGDNYSRAKELLLPLASSVEEEYVREKHLGMIIDGWVVELHGTLYSGLSSRVEKELDKLQEDTLNGGQGRSWMNGKTRVPLLKVENDAFYVFTHILQHFYKGGIGLRQICDWCRLLCRYQDVLDLRLLESRIKKAGLMSEWKAFATLAVEYLGMQKDVMPFYSDSACWRRKAARIMNFVMISGNFGNNRDMSYYSKYPYLMRKCISMGRRIVDLFRHTRIFPMDSLRFSISIINNGIRSAVRGE